MTAPAKVEVVPVTPERWPDLVDLFTRKGPRGGTPVTDGCWCQFWLLRGKEASEKWGAPGRRRLQAEVKRGTEPGLLAYLDGVPVGWCRIGPRAMFERLAHSATLRPVDDQPVWSVVCFYVHPAAKRQGVARALLAGAERLAASHGARSRGSIWLAPMPPSCSGVSYVSKSWQQHVRATPSVRRSNVRSNSTRRYRTHTSGSGCITTTRMWPPPSSR